ncbi:cytochrome B5-like protein isoform X2 [Tasmannia lanceolata]|uniref:cytochrome B5-like protein isoform X2 n=1 Tax=Tasmannia lanceolata TaxID=3420 RepID=UPI004063B4CD
MVAILMALILGVLFAAILIMPRAIKGNAKVVPPNPTTTKASKLFTKPEVSLHNTRTDCWIIIKDKVYDVTPYVEEHPGGDAILAHAGDDSTEGFYGPQHATRVFDMVDEFYIGDLKQ